MISQNTPVNEWLLIFIIGGVQFINILGFMIVVPLGPDLSIALGIDADAIGLINGSYSLTAAFVSLLVSRYLDRYPLKLTLCVALAGLSLGFFLTIFSFDLNSIVTARIFTGLFTASVGALSVSIVIRCVAENRRGRVLGAVFSAFSVASVMGIPLSLEVAKWGGWRLPFITVGMLGLIAVALVWFYLPGLSGEKSKDGRIDYRRLFYNVKHLWAYVISFLGIFGNFLLVPVLPVYFIFNLGFERESLAWLYFFGGLASFLTLRLAGRAIDKWGSTPVLVFSFVLTVFVLYSGIIRQPVWLPVMVFLPLLMVANSSRHLSTSTLSSKVPEPEVLAGFMSTITSLQHFAVAIGSIAASAYLRTTAEGRLEGMPGLAALTAVLAGVLLLATAFLEKNLRGVWRPVRRDVS